MPEPAGVVSRVPGLISLIADGLVRPWLPLRPPRSLPSCYTRQAQPRQRSVQIVGTEHRGGIFLPLSHSPICRGTAVVRSAPPALL